MDNQPQTGPWTHLRVESPADGVYWIRFPEGRQVSGHAIRELLELSSDVLDRSNAKLLIDLTGLPMANSALMGMLVTVKKRCLSAGAQMHVVCPAANVREQFEVMNLHLILKLFDDLETARRQFKP